MIIPIEELTQQPPTSFPQRKMKSHNNSSKWSGRTTHPSAGRPGSARATDTADTGTNLPTQVKLGRTTSSALGLIIKTLADREEASTSLCPTTTPYSSVKLLDGSTKAQEPSRTPDTENGPAVTPTNSSNTPAHQGSVSDDVIVMSIGLLPITAPFVNLIDVADMTAGLPYPADCPIEYWPPQTACHNSFQEKLRLIPVPPSQSTGTSLPRPTDVHTDAAWTSLADQPHTFVRTPMYPRSSLGNRCQS